MTTSRRLVAGTLVVLLGLAAVAVVTEFSGKYQVLPFSSWELFSRQPPQERADFGVRLLTIDGVAQDPPVYFESSGLPDASSPTAYELVQDIGRAADQDRPADAAAAWATFKGRYLGGAQVQAELVRRRYDVLEVGDCECYLDEVVIAAQEDLE